MEKQEIKTTKKVNYKKDIEPQMKMYRKGLLPLPQSYIDYHRDLAMQSLSSLMQNGLIVKETKMVSDGWMDGMKVLQAVVQLPVTDQEMTISWGDSNSKGGWAKHFESGGRGGVNMESELVWANGLEIKVTRGSSKDIDSVNLTVEFTSGTYKEEVEGHINHRTNMVHLSAESEEQEEKLNKWGVDLDKIAIDIENREIELH